MVTFARVVQFLADMLNRRRVRWIEISMARAWSHDLPPRLFDLGDR